MDAIGTGKGNGMSASFLTIRDVQVVDDLPPLMADLRAGALDVIRLHGVFSPDTCARMVSALEANAPGFEVTEFPGPFRSFFYGRNLNLNEPDLDGYFTAAADFRDRLARFGASLGVDVEGRIACLLSALDAGRPVEPAPGPGEARHFFTTFRGHRTGGYIPAHFDNEQGLRPSYRHVAAATAGDILSFVVTLAEAEGGGQLELFDLVAGDPGSGIQNDDAMGRKPDLSTLRSERIAVPAGSMLIVQSGRRLHRVTPVEGPRTRWTLCSFMALSRTGDRTFAWG